MIFSSYSFIFIFFPITFIGYLILRTFNKPLWVKLWLSLASLVFYAWGQPAFLAVFVFTLLFNFAMSRLIIKYFDSRPIKNLIFALAVIENIGILFYFKYYNFFAENVSALFGNDYILKNIILPIGISFYSFQILSFVADTKTGRVGKTAFSDYMLYITFFPQLIVGPVVRQDKMLPQLKNKAYMRPDKKDIMLAILLFAIGCAKKTVIADPLIDTSLSFYSTLSGGVLEAWQAVISFTFAYYFDFSGYIDMALGLALFFGLKLPHNFDSPYKARNMAEFWRRWNITISEFFNDYIFKNVFHFGDRIPKLILATLVTFAVSGIWHGAGWNFILWGIVNGILVAITNILVLKGFRLPSVIAYPLTFFFVLMTRVLFDSASLADAARVYDMMFTFDVSLTQVGDFLSANAENVIIIIVAAVICFCFKNTKQISENFLPTKRAAFAAGILLALALVNMSKVSQFLYFQF